MSDVRVVAACVEDPEQIAKEAGCRSDITEVPEGVMALLSKQERRHFPDWDDAAQCLFRRVEINLEACDGCKLCAIVCPANVLELYGEKGKTKARVKQNFRGCASCNNCQAICENGAIAATHAYDFVGFYRQLGRGEFSLPRNF